MDELTTTHGPCYEIDVVTGMNTCTTMFMPVLCSGGVKVAYDPVLGQTTRTYQGAVYPLPLQQLHTNDSDPTALPPDYERVTHFVGVDALDGWLTTQVTRHYREHPPIDFGGDWSQSDQLQQCVRAAVSRLSQAIRVDRERAVLEADLLAEGDMQTLQFVKDLPPEAFLFLN